MAIRPSKGGDISGSNRPFVRTRGVKEFRLLMLLRTLPAVISSPLIVDASILKGIGNEHP